MKYLSFYDSSDKEKRSSCLAATNKMKYICKSLVEVGENVEIISASMASSIGRFKGRTEQIDDGITLKMFPAFKWGNIFQKLWAKIAASLILFFYLLFHIKRGEKILVYHSLAYMSTLRFTKFIKRFKMILEVEEIYGDVACNKKTVKRELSFFKKADAYVFPTELLDNLINVNKKPSVIIHGTYEVEKICGQHFNDGKIHIVYAGTFDPRKGGSAAAAAGEYLDEQYHIHIIGFGTENDKKLLINTIKRVNSSAKCVVSYDGLLSGEEYIKFIQSCDIGLSTQNPDAAFNTTSFPSKILSYMANGLKVVSIKIPAIEQSAIGEYMYYYDKQTPEEIAKAIKRVDINDGYDSRSIIKKLSEEFTNDLGELLNKVEEK